MTIGAIGAVSPQVTPQVNPQANAEGIQGVGAIEQANGGQEGQGVESKVTSILGPRFTPMVDKMSTKDFVSLLKGVNGTDDNMKNIKEMVKVMMALEILEKTMEAVSDILENVLGSGDKGSSAGRM